MPGVLQLAWLRVTENPRIIQLQNPRFVALAVSERCGPGGAGSSIAREMRGPGLTAGSWPSKSRPALVLFVKSVPGQVVVRLARRAVDGGGRS